MEKDLNNLKYLKKKIHCKLDLLNQIWKQMNFKN